MNQPKIIKSKKTTKITINTSRKNTIFSPFKSLKNILKEKILYDNLCNIHHISFFKYCISCKKDICSKCETESHKDHKIIIYENILPDINEMNIIQKTLKEYKNNYLELIKLINIWKKNFENILYEYENQMDIIIDYVNKFNNEKTNFNNIYKFRSSCSLLLDNIFNNNEDKNNQIVELMENILKDRNKNENSNYIQRIKRDYNCFISHNQLIKLIKTLNNETFINQSEYIINVIDYNNDNKNNNNSKRTPNLNINKNNNNTSYENKNTSASTTINTNYYYKLSNNQNNQNNISINQNKEIKDNSSLKLNTDRNHIIDKNKDTQSKSSKNINYQNCNNRYQLNIYEKKTIRDKSNENVKPIFKDTFQAINNSKNTTKNPKTNINLKLNKNILQELINKVKIERNLYDNYINSNCCSHKITKRNEDNYLKQNKTQDIVSKTLRYDIKGFDFIDRDSGAQLLNNSSCTIEGIKLYSNTLRSNSFENKHDNYKNIPFLGKSYFNNNFNSIDNKKKALTIDKSNNSNYRLVNQMMTLNKKNFKTINTIDNNNNYLTQNKEINKSYKDFNTNFVNYYKNKKNNNVNNIFIGNKYDTYNSLVINNINSLNNENKYNSRNRKNQNKIYNNSKKNQKIYIHKKYNYSGHFDNIKNLINIDNINNSISSYTIRNIKKNNIIKENYSSRIMNINNNFNNNYITINGNKPLFIGFELGNSE